MAAINIPVSNDARTRTLIVSASTDSSVRLWGREQLEGKVRSLRAITQQLCEQVSADYAINSLFI